VPEADIRVIATPNEAVVGERFELTQFKGQVFGIVSRAVAPQLSELLDEGTRF